MSAADWVDTALGNLKLWAKYPNSDYLLGFAQLDLLKACGQKSLTKTDKEKLIAGLLEDAREHLQACVTRADFSPALQETFPSWQKYKRCLSAALTMEKYPLDKVSEHADFVLHAYRTSKQDASVSALDAQDCAALDSQKTLLVRGQLGIWGEASLETLRNPDFTSVLKTLLNDSYGVVHALIGELARRGLDLEEAKP